MIMVHWLLESWYPWMHLLQIDPDWTAQNGIVIVFEDVVDVVVVVVIIVFVIGVQAP